MMTARERFLTVLRGEIPDRVPVTLFTVGSGHFINQIYPEVNPWDVETLPLKVIELQKQLGVDVFVRLASGINEILYLRMGGLNLSQQTEHWEVRTEEIQHGNTRIERSTIKTPDGTLTQDCSITEIRPGTFVFACTKKPIKTSTDLEIAMKYEPGIPEFAKKAIKKHVRTVKTALSDDGILGVWTHHGPFNHASLLIDHDMLYMLFLTDYRFYEMLMTFVMRRTEEYISAIDEAGPDVLLVGGNVPGGFLGKKHYDRYILPFEKEHIEFVQQNGTPAMYHNCGEVMNLIESYKELGVKIVEPFSPPPLGDADLQQVKERVNGNYIILSGIDQVNVLQKGTVEQVKRATEETIRIGKPGGKFIMQPVDFLEYGTPLENVEAYVKTGIEHAGY